MSIDYKSLDLQYQDPNNLQSLKLKLVCQYIVGGSSLLDIGMGTGEFIELIRPKFKNVFGIDYDTKSIEFCETRFRKCSNVSFIQSDLDNLEFIFQKDEFDYITCLDVLEHIELDKCQMVLKSLYYLTKDSGTLIFTGPGIFDKFKIIIGKSAFHLHGHSSYGWMRLIRKAGFEISNVETVEFPLVSNEFLRKNVHLFGKCCLIVAKKI